MDTGIYILEFTEKYFYVGCSIDISKRVKYHFSSLRNNTHHNYKVQNLFNKLKIYPAVEILGICSKEDLYIQETFWIKELDAINSLNISSGDGGPSYTNRSSKRKYRLISPSGMLFLTNNLLDFCRKHDLTHSCMSVLVSGKIKTHKGWKADTNEYTE